MGEAHEESSSGKKRRRKAEVESTVVRAAPYDPVRQETTSHTAEGSPASTQQPPQGQPQLEAATNLHPQYHHSTPQSHSLGDNPQRMQTDQ
jgi:hypothetical protein